MQGDQKEGGKLMGYYTPKYCTWGVCNLKMTTVYGHFGIYINNQGSQIFHSKIHF